MDDDLEDPCWNWPYWKFGLKKDDFGKLQGQYNTIASPIQDPEAFHHDVYEISQEAVDADEFHRLLQDRKQQRLRELNESLESAAFEIIANPSLIGTDQWQYAVQLFRTKSLDSLVRYFASYLPQDHHWHKDDSASENGSSIDSLTHSHGSFFGDDADGFTDEPLDMPTSYKSHLPPSPRSMTMGSDSSVASPLDHRDYILDTLTPPRTLSFSESEPDCCDLDGSHHQHDEDVSQPCGADSPATSISDILESTFVTVDNADVVRDEPHKAARRPAADVLESETPTPKPERQATSFFEAKPSLPHRRHRSVSPSRPLPLHEQDLDDVLASHRDPRSSAFLAHPARSRRRDCSPMQRRRRFGEPATRIQKMLPDGVRLRPRGRRRDESR
ncbi:hypothetical protein B0T24DRAFT_600722 [Lasiosphaeria ovina]|uniref:Uncharacterized protein n=1 Tax=Lasiosphaeria ovina TaxID=92902 RepID=A0AAE0NIM1_9PEZI|nr:hypothetical protein B0T24DRAFT_600722 [Lasiosphaeria ovina]